MIEDIKSLTARFFKVETTIDADLATARKQVTDLTAVLEIERAALAQARADLATATQTIGSLQTQVATLQNERAAAIVAAQNAAAEAAKNNDTTVAIKAASIVAAQGVPPLAIKPDTTPAAGAPKIDPKLKGRARLVAQIENEINPS